jgi:hypothetical protein
VKSKDEHAHNFLLHQGNCSQRFVLAGQQSILHNTVTFYSNGMKMFEDFTKNFGDKRTGCCITTAHRLILPSRQEIFDQKQHECRPPTIVLYSLSSIEDKTERQPF